MRTFVKICPKCGQHNPEYENACSVCAHFIGMETPVPASTTQGERIAPEPIIRTEAPRVATDEARTTATATATDSTAASQTLYLQVLNSNQVFEIHDGFNVGQAHPSSDASLQLRDLHGIEFVHRNHCSFCALVTGFGSRSFNGLFDGISGQNSIDHWN